MRKFGLFKISPCQQLIDGNMEVWNQNITLWLGVGETGSYSQIIGAQRLIGAFRAQYTLCNYFLKNSKNSHSLCLFFGQKWKNNDFLIIWRIFGWVFTWFSKCWYLKLQKKSYFFKKNYYFLGMTKGTQNEL